MDEWVIKALRRWPNVPALFGWLGLSRRGRWLIQGESISHQRIVTTLSRNYAGDEQGRWYFQNGPQRGYVQLESTPLILFVTDDRRGLVTHTGLLASQIRDVYLDEEGAVVAMTEHGAAEIAGSDLPWILERLSHRDHALNDDALAAALALDSGSVTDIVLTLDSATMPLRRLDFADIPSALGFVREPMPREDEKVATRAMD